MIIVEELGDLKLQGRGRLIILEASAHRNRIAVVDHGLHGIEALRDFARETCVDHRLGLVPDTQLQISATPKRLTGILPHVRNAEALGGALVENGRVHELDFRRIGNDGASEGLLRPLQEEVTQSPILPRRQLLLRQLRKLHARPSLGWSAKSTPRRGTKSTPRRGQAKPRPPRSAAFVGRQLPRSPSGWHLISWSRGWLAGAPWPCNDDSRSGGLRPVAS
mmetsp:Transcript_9788/g.28734  ORF Transcript_9788/g.28734 Transcript_9788/m.28734 type:complete len:221 (+) Transcript_9788:2639-3301(+)